MRLDKKRGLLIAALSYVAFAPSALEIYDLSADCRAPVLKSATPLGIFGHESGLAPDGKTYYIAGLDGQTLAAVDISNATQPRLIWLTRGFFPHGMSVSDDGNRLYVTERASRVSTSTYRGVTILDVTEVQKRTLNPNVPVISRTTWPNVGTPQFAEPFTSGGRKYLMEIDEFGEDATHIGAGRILDLQDEKKPVVISNLRLKVNQEQAQLGEQKTDPGASVQFQGYRGHNCVLPTRVNPTMVACSFIVSGLRIFDIQDPAKPQEVAYFNGKIRPSSDPSRQGAFALAAPAFSPRKSEIWHADGNLGFHVVQLTANAKRVGPAADKAAVQAKRPAAPSPADGPLPATGLPLALPALGVLSLAVLLGVRRRRTV